jgi:antitoxin (DNA-binding transcriptional repressor) of toxin-antitoxin stability system
MKTATVRDLRNEFARVAAWIENGEEVVITQPIHITVLPSGLENP